jgi:spore coat polysaccharide biosynthesis protein SpsF (cytidylyltransferase family)
MSNKANTNKVVIIVQARMGATRLPGKMMIDIAGKPVIQHVIERARLSKKVAEVWLATTTSHVDDVLDDWAQENDVPCYRGSEDDVLDRYYKCAEQAGAGVVVRVTGDCPLNDFKVIDLVIDEYTKQKGAVDYVSNIHPPTYPDGLDTEVFSFAILEQAWKEAKLKSEREHVTPYIWKNPNLFKLKNIEHTEDLSKHRWTLDTPEDLHFLRLVIEEGQSRSGFCGLNQILSIVDAHPDWQEIVAGIQRNEGYMESLKTD